MRRKGKTALITAAGHGIGKASAAALADPKTSDGA